MSGNNPSILCWAKLGDNVWPEEYHPLICHLIDVGQVARQLWDKVIRSHLKNWVTRRLGLDNENSAAGSWIAFWAATHDIGKMSPCFQFRGEKKTGKLYEQLEAAGFNFPKQDNPHGQISTRVLVEELEKSKAWPTVRAPIARRIAIAVGGHHGAFPTDWSRMVDALGNEKWSLARHELLVYLSGLFEVSRISTPNLISEDDQSIWMFLAGMTSVADWIGSNAAFFPSIGNATLLSATFDVDSYFQQSGQKAQKALEALGWLHRGDSTSPVSFTDLFPFIKNPRPLQIATSQLIASFDKPGLLIIEAPMGEGKTEAAWYAAASWDRRSGQGTYIALPTMATSNQMFERVEKFLECEIGKSNLQLLHGKSSLNDQFEKLKYAARVYDEDISPSAVVAESWFATNKKHGLLAPYGVGTIDQALLAVLQTKHVFVRLFGLAGKCVILDEVHAYDAYMTTLMERLLRWLAALGCPVMLLSATLPKERRIALLRAYAGDSTSEPSEVAYPRITSVSVGGVPNVIPVEADRARTKTVNLVWVPMVNLIDRLKTALAGGGCVAIIRNTVGLAQDCYLLLRNAFEEEIEAGELQIHLFHARFPFGQRKKIEDDVLQKFGKTNDDVKNDDRILSAPHRPKKAIVVATQVIEQSLDLDFDLMVSDVAPVDLVLQRAGRLHRHDRDGRSANLNESQLWLIEPETLKNIPNFGVSRFVYSEFVLFRSLLALRWKCGSPRVAIQLPLEIDELIKEVYSDPGIFESFSPEERRFLALIKTKHDQAEAKEKDEAEGRQIKKPQYRGELARITGEPREEDNPDLHPAHQALTRLARPTAQLICLSQNHEGFFSIGQDKTTPVSITIRNLSDGGVKDIKQILLTELTTSHAGVVRELWCNPRKPKNWSQIGILRNHHLILFVNGCAPIGPYRLLIDTELGLKVIRADGDIGDDE